MGLPAHLERCACVMMCWSFHIDADATYPNTHAADLSISGISSLGSEKHSLAVRWHGAGCGTTGGDQLLRFSELAATNTCLYFLLLTIKHKHTSPTHLAVQQISAHAVAAADWMVAAFCAVGT